MGINNRERFENHMNISSPETIGDAERMTDVEEQAHDPYEDMFDEKLNLVELSYSDKSIDSDYNLPDKSIFLKAEDIAFESIVDANPQFGEGGGRQIFVRDFEKMVDDGRLKHIEHEDEILSISPDTGNSVVIALKSSNDGYPYSIDERTCDENEIEQLDQGTSLEQGEAEFQEPEKEGLCVSDQTVTIYDGQGTHKMMYTVETGNLTNEEQEEWDELDQNTIDEQGLTRVMENKEAQQKEDWGHPLSDQEGSNGIFYPDGWEKSRKLEVGEIFYQIRPLQQEHSSPYVTDRKTIDECRNKDGNIDAGKLLGKLQIRPVENTVYILRTYEYLGVSCTKSNVL
ncbi:MAG: hypothetical protein Q4C58_09490 [Eubacteriales bacterium]|nr:hypothetical protein [Eubacteriales bacterium]